MAGSELLESDLAQRISDVLQLLLKDRPCIGRPAATRRFWEPFREVARERRLHDRAAEVRDSKIPENSADAYLAYLRTGRREPYEHVALRRREILRILVLAECAEHRGRNLEALERITTSLLEERTWVAPAHDDDLANFHGERIDIDLYAAGLAAELGLMDRLLGDALGTDVRTHLRAEMRRRIFAPFQDMMTGVREPAWWLAVTNNWNTACLAGVVTAALCVLDDRPERALFIASAEFHSRRFLEGFYADGYCSEGVDYWNYGFGSYYLLSEAIREATGDAIDLMARPEVEAIASFARRVEITEGVYPTSADCTPGTRPDPLLVHYLSTCFGWPEPPTPVEVPRYFRSLMEVVLWLSWLSRSRDNAQRPRDPTRLPVRDWFPDAGVLISRPVSASRGTFAAFIKGGHNDEHHNHNDVGSFIVAYAGSTPLTDIGGEVYTRSTFGPDRYESEIMNSFGHDVPVVAGQLQRSGRDARAVVLSADFGAQRDVLLLDLRAAYDVASLRLLEREFVYDRSGAGMLTIIDRVAFESPDRFETALVTLDEWRQVEPGLLEFGSGDARVSVRYASSDAAIRIDAAPISGEIRSERTPWRISLTLEHEVTEVEIVTIVRPCT